MKKATHNSNISAEIAKNLNFFKDIILRLRKTLNSHKIMVIIIMQI